MKTLLAAAAIVVIGGTAHADVGVGGSIGLGATVAPIVWDSPGDSAFAAPMQSGNVHETGTLAGLGLDLDVFVGAPLSDRLRLGGVIGVGFVGPGGNDQLAYSQYGSTFQASLGVRAVLHSDALTYRFTAGAEMASFAMSGVDIGAFDNVVEPETVVGPFVGAEIGWTLVALDLRAGYLVSAHTTYVPLMLTVRVTFGKS